MCEPRKIRLGVVKPPPDAIVSDGQVLYHQQLFVDDLSYLRWQAQSKKQSMLSCVLVDRE